MLAIFLASLLRSSSLGRCNDGDDAGRDVPSRADATRYPLEEAFRVLDHHTHSLIED